MHGQLLLGFFKYQNHQMPGDVNVHYFGTVGFSFGVGLELEDNDEMLVSWENMGRPLKNILKFDKTTPTIITINQL